MSTRAGWWGRSRASHLFPPGATLPWPGIASSFAGSIACGILSGVGTAETCSRCKREFDIGANEFIYGESIGGQYVCQRCITGEEQQDIDDNDSYFAEGLRKWRNEIGVTTTQRDADYAAGYAAEKVRENRLRRMAERQGHQLVKSRRRDPRAYDYGRYWITDPATKVIVAGHDRFGMSLDEAEVWLTGEESWTCQRPARG
jgi:hypothetical protein